VVAAVLLELLDAAGRSLVLARDLVAGLVADRRKLDSAVGLLLVARGGSSVGWAGGVGRTGGGTGTVIVGLALVLLLLLASLPLLSDFFELCGPGVVSEGRVTRKRPEAVVDPC
jgi:hypothetical protein